ncbi:MAG: hypothetical protein IIZ55_07605 [Firmicutes bacterium]|nr:hypothetical protein [Bacillota bacterium]
MSDQNDFKDKNDGYELIWDDTIPEIPEAPKPEEAAGAADAGAATQAADPFAVKEETPEPAAAAGAGEKPEKKAGKEKKERKGLFGRKAAKDAPEAENEPSADAPAEAAGAGKGKKKRAGFLFKLKLFLILILLILIVFGTFMYLIPAFNRAEGTKVSGSADWMAQLGDTRRISMITIPGTHDSATKNVQFAYIFKCQSFTIEKQLEAGYRYLDIRLELDEGQLKLVHAFADCKKGSMPWGEDLYLEDVLKQCYDFLDEHPTEFVIFAVKQEHGRASVNEFERLLTSYIMETPEKWLLTDKIPTVGQARGKLILMRRYEDAAGFGQNAGIPLIWEDQGSRKNVGLNIAQEDNGTYTLWVQDRYQYEADEKWTAFTAGLKEGKADASDISIHFLSTKGKGMAGHPYKFARELNAKLASEVPALSGWIIMDFASAPMAEQVYKCNFN